MARHDMQAMALRRRCHQAADGGQHLAGLLRGCHYLAADVGRLEIERQDAVRVMAFEGLTPRRAELFYEHPTITSKERIRSSVAVVRRDLKYVQWPEWSDGQLFDLEHDSGEPANLA